MPSPELWDEVGADVMNSIQPAIPEVLKWELTEYEREGGWFVHGRAEGHLGGKRDALLLIADKRGLAPTPEQRALIERCEDEAQLDQWIARALIVDTADALLADVDP